MSDYPTFVIDGDNVHWFADGAEEDPEEFAEKRDAELVENPYNHALAIRTWDGRHTTYTLHNQNGTFFTSR